MSLVQYIGSTFLGHLIAAKQKVTASHGRFILCGFNPVVEEVFRVTRLDGFFEIADVEAVVPKGGVNHAASGRQKEEQKNGLGWSMHACNGANLAGVHALACSFAAGMARLAR